MSGTPGDERPIDILDSASVRDPFGPLQYLDLTASDPVKTDNTIRLVIFAGIVIVSLAATVFSGLLLSSEDKDRRDLGGGILVSVVTGFLGLGAGAGLR